MTRSLLRVCIAITGVLAGCNRSPAGPTPTGVELFAAGRVSMTFTGQDDTFTAATEAYRRVWVDEGSRIVEAMERGTGLTFQETNVKAVIFEGVSRAGLGGGSMYLRASYPENAKKSALVHEHGHRLIEQLKNRPADLDEHRVLFLFLYDVWESLWGKDFADAQVKFESGLTGLYDYDGAWKSTLSLSKEQRAARFAAIVNTNRR